MKNIFLLLPAFWIISISTPAQVDSKKQIIHGVVKNGKNNPVPDASVIVEGEEKGTVTDSLGFFRIEAKPNSILIINAPGYELAMKHVRGKDLIMAELVKETSDSSTPGLNETVKQQLISNALKDFGKVETGKIYHGSSLPAFHQNEETRGSRYFFKDWVTGLVINNKGSVISDENCLFNYDKISHSLFVTKDKKLMIRADNADIQSFTLKHENGEYKFEKIPAINADDFFIALVEKEGKHALYKSVKTTFEKANYRTDGLVEMGKNYDEFVDENSYYLFFPGENEFKKIALKKKNIREVLAKDDDKLRQYFSKNYNPVDELFLIKLINFINE